MFEAKWDVHKITEMKDDCIFKTKKIKSIWLPVKIRGYAAEREIAIEHGGDQLVATTETRIS